MPRKTTRAPSTILVTTRLDKATVAEMTRRAKAADRTIAAEVRRAVRFYLQNVEVAA